MRRFACRFVCYGLTCCLWSLMAAEGPTVPDRFDVSLDAVASPYTERLIAIGKEWAGRSSAAPAETADTSTNPVALHCYNTPGSKSYVGVKSEMVVDTPVSRVDEVVADIDHYKDLYPGFKDIHIATKENNHWLTSWEQIIPVFFLPNLHYDLIYVVDKSQAQRPIYRSQLKQAGSLKTFDGLILFEAASPSSTRYIQYSFFDADYGMLLTLAPSKIWSGALEAAYLSDLGVKYRAEHPDWTFEQVREAASKMLDRFAVDDIAAARKALP